MPKYTKRSIEKKKASLKKTVSSVKTGIKNYVKDVVGGAKIVGGTLKKIARKRSRRGIKKAMKKIGEPGALYNALKAKNEKSKL